MRSTRNGNVIANLRQMHNPDYFLFIFLHLERFLVVSLGRINDEYAMPLAGSGDGADLRLRDSSA